MIENDAVTTRMSEAAAVRRRSMVSTTSKRRTRTTRGDTWMAVLLISPAMFAFALFVIVPIVGGLALSFFEWDLFGTPVFVGMDNFARLVTDARMWQSLGVTASFVVLGVAPTILLGFLLAVAVNVRMPGIGGWRVLYFAPMLASAAVSAVLWASIYKGRSGVLNQLLALFGVMGPNWLSDPFWAQPALVIIMIWSALPLVIILYMAALQRIPEDIYSAAALDGAGKWRTLWSITWPSVRSATVLIAILQAVGFVGGAFELALIMTDGGPLGRTESLALYAYKVAFGQLEMGYSSALSLFQLVAIAVLVLLGRLVTRLMRSAG